MYEDIIALERPAHENDLFSRRHPKMERQNRAKLFAPYAALRGYEECVAARQVPYEPRRCLDEDEARELNRRIGELYPLCRTGALARKNRVAVRVEYFVPCRDMQHEAYGREGQYRVAEGVVRRLDVPRQCVTVGNRTIAFSDISTLSVTGSQPIAGAP